MRDLSPSSRTFRNLDARALEVGTPGDDAMIDLGVAVTWIAISAVSAKGLTVFARAAAATDLDTELAVLPAESGSRYDGYPTKALRHPQSLRP